jgi:hypothetical protein
MTIQEWAKIPYWEKDYTHFNKAWSGFPLCKLGKKIIVLHHLRPGCKDYELWSPVVPMFIWCHKYLHSERNKGKKASNKTKVKMSLAAKGRIFSEKHRKNLSEACKGKSKTKEAREKISKAHIGMVSPMKGKHHTEFTKQRISENKKGKPLSENTKKKMSKSRIGKPTPMYGLPAWNKGLKGVQVAWNKGIPQTETQRRKNSESHKGKNAHNKGKPMSVEQKRKLSESLKKLIMLKRQGNYGWK